MKLGFLLAAFLSTASVSQAATLLFGGTLSGAAEFPPNLSPGTGTFLITIDDVALTMFVHAEFSGLTGTVTAAHIHSGTAVPFTATAGVATPVPTFPGFPLGVTAGVYDAPFDMKLSSSWNPAFISANGGTAVSAFAAFMGAATTGRAYLNIHSTVVTGGEIRGFLVPVPEPTATGLAGLALVGLALGRRRRK